MEPGLLAAGATAWLWDKFGKEWVGKLGEEGKKRWERVRWQEAAETYRQRVIADYGTMRVLGMTEPVTLEGIFTDAYILDRPTAWQRHNIEELQQEPGHLVNAQRIPGLEVLRKKHRLFILGKPGAGKTTFLKYVALSAARGDLDFVPIFVSLNAWANSKHTELLPYLAQEFACCDFPDALTFMAQLLGGGKALVLLDGLDEVPQEGNRRADRSRLIHDFGKIYHRCPCLITCRTAATDYTFEPFTYVEIADFDDAQIKTFVNKWFRENEAKHSKFTDEFYRDENKGLQELASTPLLLTLLCLAFDETGYFPKRRVDLYEEALNALLQKWDASRGILRDEAYKKLSPKRKRQMFARIAHATFKRGDYFLREEPLARQIAEYLHHVPPINQEEEIDGKAVLKAIEAQHGILIERARGIYSFSHLTFQEYFTALYIVENAGKDTLPKLMEHSTASRWREVFLMVASLLDDADDFFAFFRFALENLITGDKQLIELVGRAARTATNANTSRQSAALRGCHVHLYLTVSHILAAEFAHSIRGDLGNDINTAFEVTNVEPLNKARNRALKLALALHFDLAQNLNQALELTHELADKLADEPKGWGWIDSWVYRLEVALVFRVAVKHVFPQLVVCFDEIREYDPRRSAFSQALTNILMPAEDSPREIWQRFNAELRAILGPLQNLGNDWQWRKEQIESLEKYLEANLLLLECLDLAYVPNRQAIEDSLLLPPGHPAS